MKRYILGTLFTISMAAISYAFNNSDLDRFLSTKECIKCDLQVINLEGKTFKFSKLNDAILTAARLKESNFEGSDFQGAILRAADLSKAHLGEANFKLAKLQDANLDGSHLINANFERANLKGASLDEAVLLGANFEGAIWLDGEKCARGSIGRCRK